MADLRSIVRVYLPILYCLWLASPLVVGLLLGCTSMEPRAPSSPEDPITEEDVGEVVERCPLDELAEGCPCDFGEVAPCYPHPATRYSIGECRSGVLVCTPEGVFGPCEGAVVPQEEVCDGKDNSCDGIIDGGLEGCVVCLDCSEVRFGPVEDNGGVGENRSFRTGVLGSGTEVDGEGNLRLHGQSHSLEFVWVANTNEGTVSKIEASTGREVGRYLSALPGEGRPNPQERCDPLQEKGNCPSRTAVDMNGDVWVANRAFGGQGSVTKIMATSDHCPPRNPDGIIRTSHDANADGRIDINSSAEFPGLEDDCVLFTVNVGSQGSIPRALAVDPFGPDPDHGSVYVGAFNEQRLYRIHGQDGRVLRAIDIPIHPYGAVMSRDRRLWVTSWRQDEDAIISVDSATNEVGPLVPIHSSYACRGGYGIAMDGAGRVWLGGWSCEAAFRYDPATMSWMTVRLQGRGYTRGVAVDGRGYVWVAHSHELQPPMNRLARVSSFRADDGGDMRVFDIPGQEETIGVGVDFQGKIWAVHRGSNMASWMDPERDQGFGSSVQVGDGPYTYSDFTGYGLRTFTAPMGAWYGVIDHPCPHGLPIWKVLRWEADVPDGTELSFSLSLAQHITELPAAPRFGPFTGSPVDLEAAGVPRGHVIKVEADLRSMDRASSPQVQSLQLEYHCPGPG